jgi:hypothetical protein
LLKDAKKFNYGIAEGPKDIVIQKEKITQEDVVSTTKYWLWNYYNEYCGELIPEVIYNDRT